MEETPSLIQRIHDSGHAFVLCVTGGGSLAVSRLLTVPGASRSVLEAAVPYAPAALAAWLRAMPEHYCVPATARLMAMAAFARARAFQPPGDMNDNKLFGVGCTASLASDRPKRGAHRVHVAWQSVSATVTYSLELEKGARDRAEEEMLAAELVLHAIVQAAEVQEQATLALRDGERVHERRTDAPNAWRDLVYAEGPPVRVGTAETSAPVLLSGAFHPLHAGHRGMAEVAARKLGRAVSFELSVKNVDKPPLDYTEIAERLAQFSPDEGVWMTVAPTFVEKARLFPGATFVVGLDTIVRIGEPRYYAGSAAFRDAAIQELAERGCRFLVFGRRCGGDFESLANASLPAALRALCEEVPEQEFRLDISSTELRRGEV